MESLGEVQPLLVQFQVMGTDLKRWVAHCETIKFSSELKTALVCMQKKVQRVTSILEHLHVAVEPAETKRVLQLVKAKAEAEEGFNETKLEAVKFGLVEAEPKPKPKRRARR